MKSRKGASHLILRKVREKQIRIALSVPLFNEYQDVLKRKKSLQDFGLQIDDINKFLRFIAYIGETYQTYFLFRPNLRDEKDNMVVETAERVFGDKQYQRF